MPGDGRLRALDTPYGRFKRDHLLRPETSRVLLAQAGALGADVMLDPSMTGVRLTPGTPRWPASALSSRVLT